MRLARSGVDEFKTSLLGEVAGAPGYKNEPPETTMRKTSPSLASPSRREPRTRALLALVLAALAASTTAYAQVEALSAEEIEELETMRRRGENQRALGELDEILGENPGDHAARALRARCRYHACDYDGAVEDARAALAASQEGALEPDLAASCQRVWLEVLSELGRGGEALAALARPGSPLRPAEDPRDAWALGHALASAGHRTEARERFQEGLEATAAEDWEQVFARARCERAAGLFERA